VLFLPTCGAAIRQVPASLDPSNPDGPESTDPPRVAEAEPAELSADGGGHSEEGSAGMEGMAGHQMPDKGAPDGGAPVPSDTHAPGKPGAILVPRKAPAGEPAGREHSMGGMKMPAQKSDSPPAVTYTCPMHLEVISSTKGSCPKCGMTLVPRKPPPGAPPSGEGAMGDMQMDPPNKSKPPSGKKPKAGKR
jgi:hypothetical protein